MPPLCSASTRALTARNSNEFAPGACGSLPQT